MRDASFDLGVQSTAPAAELRRGASLPATAAPRHGGGGSKRRGSVTHAEAMVEPLPAPLTPSPARAHSRNHAHREVMRSWGKGEDSRYIASHEIALSCGARGVCPSPQAAVSLRRAPGGTRSSAPPQLQGGPAQQPQTPFASRSVQRALLTPTPNPGSSYRYPGSSKLSLSRVKLSLSRVKLIPGQAIAAARALKSRLRAMAGEKGA